MSVLEKIRSKTGLLVGFVGLALFIFIIQSALETGSNLFGSNERTVGTIAGKHIDYNEYRAKLDEAIARYQQSGQPVDEQVRQQLIEQVWSTYIQDLVLRKSYVDAGISVSDDELTDLMLINPHQIISSQFSDRQSGRVIEQFAKPDGTLDPAKLRAFVQQMTPEQERFWADIEKYVKDTRLAEKYNNVVKKGLYATTLETKTEFLNQTTTYNVRYVVKRYSEIADSLITLSDKEIADFYNQNSFRFQNAETTRKIEYVAFDAYASNEDVEEIKKQMASIVDEFKSKKTASEDSALISSESENGTVDIGNYKRAMISPEIDSAFLAGPNGEVFGPYIENNHVKLTKLVDRIQVLDSGKVRHILIGYQGSVPGQDIKRSKEQAKKLADSLVQLVKKDNKRFAELVKTYSEDNGKNLPPGKKEGEDYIGKDGVYGWVNENSGFVDSFKDFALKSKKGDVQSVESNFGYHVMEQMEVSKGTQSRYRLANIIREIRPSDATLNKFNSDANEFAGKYNTAELFDKGVEEKKLNKRIADNIKEADKSIPGIEEPKELIRWTYAGKPGDISNVFQFGNRFIVAKLVEVKEKGTAPLEQVKDEVILQARRDKKAQKFTDEINKTGSKSLDDLAAKLKLNVDKMDNLYFGAYSVSGLGREDVLVGTVAALKEGTISKPLKGQSGVIVVALDKKNTQEIPKDLKPTQKGMMLNLASRVDYEAFEAVKKIANIEDHRARFDF